MAFYSLDDAHIDVLMKVALQHVREEMDNDGKRGEEVRESVG